MLSVDFYNFVYVCVCVTETFEGFCKNQEIGCNKFKDYQRTYFESHRSEK